MLIISSSLPFETDLIVNKINNRERLQLSRISVYGGKFANKNLIIANLGLGKVNAASKTTLLLEHLHPDLFILIGCGGAYKGTGLGIGDIAIADEEIYGDEGVLTPEGWQPLELIGIPLLQKEQKKIYNSFSIDKKLVRDVGDLLRDYSPRIGHFVTVSTCTGSDRKADEMVQRFNGICENMEGAAVAHICLLYNVPFLEIRGMSNLVQDRDIRKWDLNRAAQNCQKAVLEVIKRICNLLNR
ncbi:MAG: futalosine hydrolase [bacterium]